MSEPAEHDEAMQLPRPGVAAGRDASTLGGAKERPEDGGDHEAGDRRHSEESAPEAERPATETVPSAQRPLAGEDAVEALYAYVRTAEFRRGFEAARGLSADELAERRRRRQRERARRSAEAIAALGAPE